MKHTLTPDASWLHGKYNWYENGRKVEAEVNTKLPYVAIGEYFWQGDGANDVIDEIHKIWISDGRRTTQSAVKKYSNLYL
jgi:hypothetical protein